MLCIDFPLSAKPSVFKTALFYTVDSLKTRLVFNGEFAEDF